MAIVKVPRTPTKSFNAQRKPSALLLDQIKHLEWAALPASQRKPRQIARRRRVKSEGQAAERIAQLTSMILNPATPTAPRIEGVQPKVVLPPLPKNPKRRSPAKRKPVKQRVLRPGGTVKAKATRTTGKRRKSAK